MPNDHSGICSVSDTRPSFSLNSKTKLLILYLRSRPQNSLKRNVSSALRTVSMQTFPASRAGLPPEPRRSPRPCPAADRRCSGARSSWLRAASGPPPPESPGHLPPGASRQGDYTSVPSLFSPLSAISKERLLQVIALLKWMASE